MLGVSRPHLAVLAEFAKGNRPRRVPLWWDSGTLADLAAWKRHRARAADPFVCSLQRATYGAGLNRHVLRRRFQTACRILGRDRLRTLTIHRGRHTCRCGPLRRECHSNSRRSQLTLMTLAISRWTERRN